MRRRDRHPLPADVQRDLDAMDAAIAGQAPAGDLATLAVAVRDQRIAEENQQIIQFGFFHDMPRYALA